MKAHSSAKVQSEPSKVKATIHSYINSDLWVLGVFSRFYSEFEVVHCWLITQGKAAMLESFHIIIISNLLCIQKPAFISPYPQFCFLKVFGPLHRIGLGLKRRGPQNLSHECGSRRLKDVVFTSNEAVRNKIMCQ